VTGARRTVLTRLQLGLEALYRVETRLEVEAFVIDDEQRRRTGVARAPREQLLIHQSDDELAMGLFVDGAALANLERNDPAEGLDDDNFTDFCLAVEGVSHFIYLALCAAGHRPVSVLELELQAEVDKFVCCVLVQGQGQAQAQRPGEDGGAGLRRRLYEDVRFADDLDAIERDRYRTANGEAGRYAQALERRFMREARLPDMLAELRRFYRLTLDGKLGAIARAAG
jgi:hypothetical protein